MVVPTTVPPKVSSSPLTKNSITLEEPNSETQLKSEALKLRLEGYYENLVQQCAERASRMSRFESQIANFPPKKQAEERNLFSEKETRFLQSKRIKITPDDYRVIQVIGKGAFGTVKLVQSKTNDKLFALKVMRKADMIKNDQLAHIKSERDLLAESQSPWVVSLYFSFQDDDNLYLLMEYLPGGDMMSLLIKLDTFEEDMVRFYVAECVLAIASVHALGFVHRDIKPDNILFNEHGHLKLTDFGLSTGFHHTHDTQYHQKILRNLSSANKKKNSGVACGRRSDQMSSNERKIHIDPESIGTWKQNRRKLAYSTVGTPDYIAPEVFQQKGYGGECDWWSLGAIMFEMLLGYPPFCAESQTETCQKIVNWRKYLYFPRDAFVSPEAEHLIRSLLCDAPNRLGSGEGGVEDIKNHPFFLGIDWDRLHACPAPWKPTLKSLADTNNFPVDEVNAALNQLRPLKMDSGTLARQKDLAFVGYTFRRFESINKHRGL